MTHPHHTLTTVAPAARHRFLAPELDGEIVALTEPVDELLLGLAEWADDDPTELPTSLHRPASDALGDIRIALNNAAYRPLYAPDGRYEHEPLTVIELPAATIDTYRAAVADSPTPSTATATRPSPTPSASSPTNRTDRPHPPPSSSSPPASTASATSHRAPTNNSSAPDSTPPTTPATATSRSC